MSATAIRPVRLFKFLGGSPAETGQEAEKKAQTRAEIAQAREIERQIARARAKLFEQLKKEAIFYWVKIREALRRMQFYHEIKGENKPGIAAQLITGKRAKQVVRCDAVEFNEDLLRFHIDGDKMPYGSMLVEMLDPNIERELSLVCNRTIRIKSELTTGVYIEVQREGSIAGIPELYMFKDAFLAIPKSAHITSFPIGMAEGRRALYDDLHNVRHLLVAGTNGSGKSVFVNSAIMTLCMRARPDMLQIWLIDLKGGIELTYYKDLPHVPEGRFIYELDQIAPALADLHEELDRRLNLLKDKAHDIGELNRRASGRKNKLPYIVIVVDEFAEITMGLKGNAKLEALTHLKRLLQKGRAAGIHFIAATQSPTKEVMDTLVRANIPARVALNCTTPTDSITVVGNASAHGLSPRGRAIWMYEGKHIYVQCALLRMRTMKKLISKTVQRWAKVHAEPSFDWDDLFRYALANMGGELPYKKLHHAFNGAISQGKLMRFLQSMDGQTIDLDGRQYYIVPGRLRSNKTRLLQPVEETSHDSAFQEFIKAIALESSAHSARSEFLKGH